MNRQISKVLVTEGAFFIGSNQVDALLERGAKVEVVDNLFSRIWRRAPWSSSGPTCGSQA
jgi:nucleoside-diphosphate-sugar epimerase